MTTAIIAILLTVIVYIFIGKVTANAFDEGNSLKWILAWPVVIAWLISVVGPKFPVNLWYAICEYAVIAFEKFENLDMNAPYDPDDGFYNDDLDDLYDEEY